MKLAFAAALLILASMPLGVHAQGERALAPARQANLAAVKKTYEANLAKYGKSADMLVRPGLLANRQEKWVRIAAEATGLTSGDPMEFWLISDESGHDYEAVAVSFARPSDVHKALVFIGVNPGWPVAYSRFRFWPKGERALVTYEWDSPGAAGANAATRQRARAEQLIVDRKTHRPLPLAGLTFTGSFWDALPDHPDQTGYAADFIDPNTIASDFNDPTTVLDVPRQADKSAVYSQQTWNPDFKLAKGQPVDVILEPEYRNGKRRVLDLTLKAGAPTNSLSIASLPCRLLAADGKAVVSGAGLKDVLDFFNRAVTEGHDPFVTLDPAPEMKLQTLVELCSFLSTIEGESGIRMDPPLAGQLYYRAFVPNEAFRERATRPTQPWELYLSSTGSTATGTLNQVEEVWGNDGRPSSYNVTTYPVSSPEALHQTLQEKQGLKVVLIFAPRRMEYAALLPFAQAAMKTHPTVYVFLPPEERPAGSKPALPEGRPAAMP